MLGRASPLPCRQPARHFPCVNTANARAQQASMDPADTMDCDGIITAILQVLQSTRCLVLSMLIHDMEIQEERLRRRRMMDRRLTFHLRRQLCTDRSNDGDDELETDLSLTAAPIISELLLLMWQLPIERRFWARETSTDWWDRIVLQLWDDSQWLHNFRMRKSTFFELCDLLSPALKRRNTNMRAALTVEKRVAIALWKLATPDCYRSVANQFGVGKSTVGAAVIQVVKAIVRLLLRQFVTLGNVQAIVDGFAAMGFPNCGGAIDGTHIPILAPEHQGAEYVNRKGYFSIVLQALVDHKGRFTSIHVGWPGRVHDARVFRNTTLFRRLQQGNYFPDQKITVGDVEMPVVILGDPAYPLMPWLMKPYTGSLDSGQELFNYRLSKCRMVVECAFGRLKARFRSLLTRSDLSPKTVPLAIAACCVLHNLCESKGDTFMTRWEAEANHLATEYGQPDTRAIRSAHQEAVRIREALKMSFIEGQGLV